MKNQNLQPSIDRLAETSIYMAQTADKLSLAVDNYLSPNCSWCGGMGFFDKAVPGDIVQVDCDVCDGSGKRPQPPLCRVLVNSVDTLITQTGEMVAIDDKNSNRLRVVVPVTDAIAAFSQLHDADDYERLIEEAGHDSF